MPRRDESRDNVSKGWSDLFSNALPLNSIFGGKSSVAVDPSVAVDGKKTFGATECNEGPRAGAGSPQYDSDGFD
jgi:hypothetical protein